MTSKRDSVGSESGESRRGSPSEEPERASEEAIASTETLSDAEPDQASAHGSDQEHDSDVTEASQRAHGPSRVFRDQTDQQTALMNQSRTEKANPKVEQIHSMPGRYDRLVGDFWTSEMLGVVISVGTIIGIVSILFSFRNGSTNHLMKGVTLNTAISILANLSRAAIVFVIASVISQQKWLRYERRHRSLYEVVLYEDASRGPWGSLLLLGSLKVGLTTIVAAVVGILALGFEPFVQQSLRYPSHSLPVTSNTPVIRASQDMNLNSRPRLDRAVLVNAAMRQALYSDSIDPIVPQCPGTRCDWPSYSSTAFYHVCEDAMDDARLTLTHGDADIFGAYQSNSGVEDLNETDLQGLIGGAYLRSSRDTAYNISLGAGRDLTFNVSLDTYADSKIAQSAIMFPKSVVWDLGDDARTLITDYAHHTYAPGLVGFDTDVYWSNSSTINGINGPLKALGHVTMKVTDDGEQLVLTSAQRCVFTYSAQRYLVKVEEGKLKLKTLQTHVGRFELNPDGGGLEWHASIGNTSFYSQYLDTTPGEGYSTMKDYYVALTGLEGNVSITLSKEITYHYGPETSLSSAQTSVANDVLQFMSDPTRYAANIAQSLTNLVQQNGNKTVRGDTYSTEPYVEVRWAWLSFPVTLVLLGLVALLVTVWQTRQHQIPLWRSSPLPLLFNYHDDNMCAGRDQDGDERGASHLMTPSRQLQEAKARQLRLRMDDGVWHFSRKL